MKFQSLTNDGIKRNYSCEEVAFLIVIMIIRLTCNTGCRTKDKGFFITFCISPFCSKNHCITRFYRRETQILKTYWPRHKSRVYSVQKYIKTHTKLFKYSCKRLLLSATRQFIYNVSIYVKKSRDWLLPSPNTWEYEDSEN